MLDRPDERWEVSRTLQDGLKSAGLVSQKDLDRLERDRQRAERQDQKRRRQEAQERNRLENDRLRRQKIEGYLRRTTRDTGIEFPGHVRDDFFRLPDWEVFVLLGTCLTLWGIERDVGLDDQEVKTRFLRRVEEDLEAKLVGRVEEVES